ncbi:MAG: signal peptide peptidase SppA [Phycisphaerales bacterium]|nr:MAG: signal peptide peptidase SppA [Phycisphaerales bacterium]
MQPTRLLCLALLAALAASVGCGPVTFSVTLGEADVRLRESAVLETPDRSRDKIAMIDIDGVILSIDEPALGGGRSNTIDRVVRRLNIAEHDPRVKGVVLRINSPGGGVTATDVLYHEIRAFRERSGKPVVASMGDTAASGGYYLALAADRVVAHPSTITGSVGVIIPTVNVSAGLASLGIQGRAVVSGPNKDIANPLQPARDEHYAILQAMVDEMHATFAELVRTRRGLEGEALASATDGRVFTGAQAVEMGLIDQTGGLRDAFRLARELAGIEGAQLVRYHAPSRRPTTPYASAELGEHAPRASLLRELVPASALEPGRAYYVWPAGIGTR